MKKLSELTGSELNSWVAKARGFKEATINGVEYYILADGKSRIKKNVYTSTREWGQGGVIIEREKIRLWYDGYWWHGVSFGAETENEACIGSTPLIAAMRCYVASVYGDTVPS